MIGTYLTLVGLFRSTFRDARLFVDPNTFEHEWRSPTGTVIKGDPTQATTRGAMVNRTLGSGTAYSGVLSKSAERDLADHTWKPVQSVAELISRNPWHATEAQMLVVRKALGI